MIEITYCSDCSKYVRTNNVVILGTDLVCKECAVVDAMPLKYDIYNDSLNKDTSNYSD